MIKDLADLPNLSMKMIFLNFVNELRFLSENTLCDKLL